MRSTADAILNSTANIQRATRTQDAFGGWSESFVTVVQSTPCAVDLVSKRTSGLLDQFGERINYDKARVITLKNGTDVQEADRIIVSGETYTVVAILFERWDIARRAVVEIVR